MKTWGAIIGMCLAAFAAQACTAMDGEESRLANKTGEAEKGLPGSSDATVPHNRGGESQSESNLQSAEQSEAASETISCGNGVCAGTTPFCCASSDASTTQCVGEDQTSCGANRFFMRCDDTTDCDDGQVCCVEWDGNVSPKKWESSCKARSACAAGQNDDASIGTAVMCLKNEECGQGSTCSFDMKDWQSNLAAITAGLCSYQY